jgi:hypothetical protein
MMGMSLHDLRPRRSLPSIAAPTRQTLVGAGEGALSVIRREELVSEYGTAVNDEAAANLPSLLRNHGFQVESHRQFQSGPAYRCTKSGSTVIVSLDKPAHWASTGDQRERMTVVATLGGGSLLQFWRRGQENGLRREIVGLLKTPASTGPSADE